MRIEVTEANIPAALCLIVALAALAGLVLAVLWGDES